MHMHTDMHGKAKCGHCKYILQVSVARHVSETSSYTLQESR